MTLNRNRLVERAAVNAFRTLMERHNFIVQEIDGGNDHGEDVYVNFTENMKRTGDTIFVQIKGGRSYKRADGYSVPIMDHREYWEKSNAPVFCVVQDPDTQELFWANASAQLRDAKRSNKEVRNIKVEKEKILNDRTIIAFSLRARLYIAEAGDLHKFLTKISGVQFDITDYLAYFENLFGEQMIFQQKRDEEAASLFHSDLDWDPISITARDVAFNKPAPKFLRKKRTPKDLMRAENKMLTIMDVILSKAEFMWMLACFEESSWIRKRDTEQETLRLLNAHRVPPILYSPRQEIEVSHKAWRNASSFEDLMEKFIELGYEYWKDIDESYDRLPTSSKPARPKNVVWDDMRKIVQDLRALGVPSYYLVGNRGRLTSTEARRVYGLFDYI